MRNGVWVKWRGYTACSLPGRGFCVYKVCGRESEGKMPCIPVHTVNNGTVDGDSVYARSMDGNPRLKCSAFPSIL